jgi:hypothetical protein
MSGISDGIVITGGNVDSNTAIAPAEPPGAGTSLSPWQISTLWQLQGINQDPARLSGYFLLMNDIDARELAGHVMIGGHEFLQEPNVFNGHFDGNGNSITINIWRTGNISNVGLFRRIGAGGVVQNLTVKGRVHVGSNVPYGFGGLAGENAGTIRNCQSAVQVHGGHHVGGLVGTNSGLVENSSASGNVSTTLFTFGAGGLVGENTGTIQYSFATGDVSGRHNVGGLVGTNNGTILSSAVMPSNINYDVISGTNIGRIWGGGTGAGSNNHASAEVHINSAAFTGEALANNLHGATVSTSTIGTQNFWHDIKGWDFTHVWRWDANLERPVLRRGFDVPPTGVPDITGMMVIMFALLVISAVSWGFVLRNKPRRSNV